MDQELTDIGIGKELLIIREGLYQIVEEGGCIFAKALYYKDANLVRLHRTTWFIGRMKEEPVMGSELIEAFYEEKKRKNETWSRHWRLDLPDGSTVVWRAGVPWLKMFLRWKVLSHGSSELLNPKSGAPTNSTLAFVIHGTGLNSDSIRNLDLKICTSRNFFKMREFLGKNVDLSNHIWKCRQFAVETPERLSF